MSRKRKLVTTRKYRARAKRTVRSIFIFKILFLIAVFIGAYALYNNFYPQYQRYNEYKYEMKELPQELKKVLSSSTSSGFRIPVLLYHYVEYVQDKGDTIRQSLNITPYTFEEQIKTFKDNNYTFLTASDVSDILDGKKKMPKKPVVITFDDGYRDFYTDAFPILKKYQAKATAYIVPNFLNRPNYMFTAQVEEIIKSGLVEIGAHTLNHVYLKGIDAKRAKEEIAESKYELEKEFNIKVVSFAYPYGAFDQETEKLVKEAGFKTAVSTIPGIAVSRENRYFIYRIRPGYNTKIQLTNYLESIPQNPE